MLFRSNAGQLGHLLGVGAADSYADADRPVSHYLRQASVREVLAEKHILAIRCDMSASTGVLHLPSGFTLTEATYNVSDPSLAYCNLAISSVE